MIMQAGGPPDTSAYYRAAYLWAAVLYAGYAAVLWLRARRVRARLGGTHRRGDGTAP